MTPPAHQRPRRGRVAMDAAALFVVIVLVVQMWLLTATLESYLAGHTDVALPAALTSAALFLVSAAVYRGVQRLDRRPPVPEQRSSDGPWLLR